MKNIISMLTSTAIGFYLVLLLWPLYMLTLPFMYHLLSLWVIFYFLFPGLFLVMWMSVCLHESLHGYIETLPNKLLFKIYGRLLFIDPQVFRICHISHHQHANSFQDIEFHPFGKIPKRPLRILNNCAEICFGQLYMNHVAYIIGIITSKTYKQLFKVEQWLISFICWLIGLAFIVLVSVFIFSLPFVESLTIPIIFLWFSGIIGHITVLIEHGNLIADGYQCRNLSRNLSSDTMLGRIFNFVTHNEVREHVLHHTHVKEPTRMHVGIYDIPPDLGIVVTPKQCFLDIFLPFISGNYQYYCCQEKQAPLKLS